MILQLCSPYTKYPFNCPMCIAATEDGGKMYDVPNLYEKDRKEYFAKLRSTIIQNKIKTVVITDNTEPTLFPIWLEELTGENLLWMVRYTAPI